MKKNREKFSSQNVAFQILNPVIDPLPNADLVIIKDVLQHIPNSDVQIILDKIKTCKFAIITNDYTDNNIDTPIGGCRPINILLAPFNYCGVTVHEYIGKHVVFGHHA